jgi:xanthine dehydrogenase accessory factor
MPIDQITDAIHDILDEGSRAVLITVAQSEHLAVGGKMLVKANHETVGDLGDPALNRVAIEQASAFLTVREEAKMLVVSDFAPELTEFAKTSLLFERIETEPHLVIAGAGHVGASLARLAALIGYRVTLIDDRTEFVARELFSATSDANIELIGARDWAASIKEAIGNGHAVAVAIVTRGHKQDEECLRAASSASPDYIGMIGSKRRTNIVLEKLREEGSDPEVLKKVRAPIGLDIGAVSPEEVALAILAEIVAERRGGSGAPLSAWRRT